MNKFKNKHNSNIKCDVYSCKNNNSKEGTCCLDNVCISCSCDNNNCHDNSTTICQSFKDTASNITDNVYEVTSEENNE